MIDSLVTARKTHNPSKITPSPSPDVSDALYLCILGSPFTYKDGDTALTLF